MNEFELNDFLGKRVVVIYDDKDKVATRYGVVIKVSRKFIILQTKPKGKQLIEAIPLERVIRIETVES